MSNPLINNGKHISRVMDEHSCGRHRAPIGVPCYHITPGSSDSFGYLAGVCGFRIKKAGYNGKISATSMRLKTPGGRSKSRNTAA